jgi:hypothetical protein
MLQVLSAAARKVWEKTGIHRRHTVVQRRVQVAVHAPLCLWYRMEEPDGAFYTACQGRDRVF